jgi:hypothetical protein
MRIVELKCGTAFMQGTSAKVSNDIVVNNEWRLHGNLIAKRTPDAIEIFDCGWRTRTTGSRLNAILRMAGTALRICQRNHVWYLYNYQTGESEPWTGSMSIPILTPVAA